MPSGEGNENSQKKSEGLISQKKTLHMQNAIFLLEKENNFAHFFSTFLCQCFAQLQRGFQKLPSYTIYAGNVVRVPVHFFVRCLSFSPQWGPLAFLTFLPLL